MKSLISAPLMLAAMLLSTAADAGCKFGSQTLDGSVAARAADHRGFHLLSGHASLTVRTVAANRNLAFRVYRPSGERVCDQAPDRQVSCSVNVSRSNAGLYKVDVRNPGNVRTGYKLSCSD